MKKILYASTLLVSLCPFARAEKQLVTDVVDSSITVNVVSLPVGIATQVDPVSILMVKRTFLSIQNLDSGFDVFCSQLNTVSTVTGFMVPKAGGIVSIPLASGINTTIVPKVNRITLYCITSNALSPSKVAIIQGY